MSRSRKRTPAGAICGLKTGTMKKFRRQCHKAARRDTKTKLLLGREDVIDCKWFYDEWASPRDGKCYYTPVDLLERLKWMSK